MGIHRVVQRRNEDERAVSLLFAEEITIGLVCGTLLRCGVAATLLLSVCTFDVPETRKQARRQIDQRKIIPPSPTCEPESAALMRLSAAQRESRL